ncbi:MAG: sigma 54-interacting transcriptional regulator [Methylobacter sp.]|uniref:sigma-54 interaction domain-containing protein n=1 Tax=Methylobacter sp. TaxID=2051955 RepID=UPI00273024DC|nr:sigma 54-interacting transcriptional regulator [Methylobacter sp.]MDP1664662.1 sigma 54-interacting transcriptional regulator [Methylobacter sp.]
MGASLNITEIRRTQLALKRSNIDLSTALEEIISLKDQLQQENIYLRHEISGHQDFGQVIGGSATMRGILTQIEQVALTPATVLILGETGSGKELLANAIHEASPRKNRSMIRVNCAAIPAALIESELFGREKGAYTGALSKQIGRFELAHGSTLFLDEVGELPLDSQAKLLRVLQEKEIERLGSPKPIKVDIRIIAATNRNLSQEVVEGRFREDLYYRLNVFPIQVPPLRDRREDIPKLVEIFIQEFSRTMDKSIDVVAKTSLQALCNYDWPGNIRELRNVIERAVILATGPVLKINLPCDALTTTRPAKSNLLSLKEVECEHILRVLEVCGWRIRGQGGAAAILGLNPSTLESRMAKLGIRRPSSS